MLDDYRNKQPVVYNLLINEIKNNNVSHAYLFDENNNSESFNIIMAFVKEIITSKMDNKLDKLSVLRRIDEGNYPEIKIISPDGMLIKKQQILDLQQEFSRIAVEGSKRVYIIRDCDKMRPETANSMLKFLEEPDNNLIAILMTNNYSNLLSTVISRCQVIRFGASVNKENNSELDELVLEFIKSIENSGIKTIINVQELIFDKINSKDRNGLINFFDKMIDMYYDIMKISIGEKRIKNSDYYGELSIISKKNNYDKILKKIDDLTRVKDAVKYNVNCNLLIDSLILNIGG